MDSKNPVATQRDESNQVKRSANKEPKKPDEFAKEDHEELEEEEDYEVAFYDPRHPNIDQMRNCFDNYVNARRCKNIYGQHFNPCEYFDMAYRQICPTDMIEKWDEFVDGDAMPANVK